MKFKPEFWDFVPEASEKRAFPNRNENTTNVLEVWFAGNHSGNQEPKYIFYAEWMAVDYDYFADVGGGYYLDGSPGNTANPSLVWMLNQIIVTRAPIFFDEDSVEKCKDWLVAQRRVESPAIDSLAGFSPVYDRFSAVTPVTTPLNDEFRGAWAVPWWVIEFFSFGWFPVRRIDGRLRFVWKG